MRKDAIMPSFEEISKNMVWVSIRISYWHAEEKLESDELEIDQTILKKLRKRVHLGKKMLFDPEKIKEFRNISSEGRQIVDEYSIKTRYFRATTASALSEVIIPRTQELEEMFNVKRNALIDNYFSLIKKNINEVISSIKAERYRPEYFRKLRSSYPNSKSLQEKFQWNLDSGLLYLPHINRGKTLRKLHQEESNQFESQHRTYKAAMRIRHSQMARGFYFTLGNEVEKLKYLMEALGTDIAYELWEKTLRLTRLISKPLTDKNKIKIEKSIFILRQLNFFEDDISRICSKATRIVSGEERIKPEESSELESKALQAMEQIKPEKHNNGKSQN